MALSLKCVESTTVMISSVLRGLCAEFLQGLVQATLLAQIASRARLTPVVGFFNSRENHCSSRPLRRVTTAPTLDTNSSSTRIHVSFYSSQRSLSFGMTFHQTSLEAKQAGRGQWTSVTASAPIFGAMDESIEFLKQQDILLQNSLLRQWMRFATLLCGSGSDMHESGQVRGFLSPCGAALGCCQLGMYLDQPLTLRSKAVAT